MAIRKYLWLVGNHNHKRGDIEELDEENAHNRLILGHIRPLYKVGSPEYTKETNQQRTERDFEHIRTRVPHTILYKDGKHLLIDKKFISKLCEDALEDGYIIESGEPIKIKNLYGNFMSEVWIYTR